MAERCGKVDKTRKAILFVKVPVIGKVKTRLGTDIGMENSCHIYRLLLQHQVNVLKTSGIPYCVYYAGTPVETLIDTIGSDSVLYSQCDGNLGEKMKRGILDQFHKGADQIILMGSDIPDITSDILVSAFEKLNLADAVIGPSDDGGYYCIGFNRESFHGAVFEGVEWSTDGVYEETVDKFKTQHMLYKHISNLYDIDTLSDVNRYIEAHDNELSRKIRALLKMADSTDWRIR